MHQLDIVLGAGLAVLLVMLSVLIGARRRRGRGAYADSSTAYLAVSAGGADGGHCSADGGGGGSCDGGGGH